MMNVLQRAMRRAEFPLAYSKGYNPKPRISFAGALPLGLESRAEEMEVTLTQPLPGREIRKRLNAELPSGLEVMEVSENQKNSEPYLGSSVTYEASLSEASWPPEGIRRFQGKGLAPLQQRSKRGEVVIPLENRLLELDMLDPGRIRLTLTQGQNGNIRIRDLLAHIFDLSEEQILKARIVKMDTKPMEG
jgi:radical SAM-linked protein